MPRPNTVCNVHTTEDTKPTVEFIHTNGLTVLRVQDSERIATAATLFFPTPEAVRSFLTSALDQLDNPSDEADLTA